MVYADNYKLHSYSKDVVNNNSERRTISTGSCQIVFDPCEKPYNVDTSGWF